MYQVDFSYLPNKQAPFLWNIGPAGAHMFRTLESKLFKGKAEFNLEQNVLGTIPALQRIVIRRETSVCVHTRAHVRGFRGLGRLT